jgi:hypothetical protein
MPVKKPSAKSRPAKVKVGQLEKRLAKKDTRKVRGGVYQHNQTDLEFLRSQAFLGGDPDSPVVVGRKK